ncbi:MAG: GNAT family N-acetyltransferase [Pseudomonadota bacterium]
MTAPLANIPATSFEVPRLETERMVLRAPTRADFEDYAAFYLSPRSGASEPTRRKAWKAFAQEIVDWSLGGVGHWTAETKGGVAVGLIGFSQPDDYPEPEIGWALYDGYERQGYATEAARAALVWARDRLVSAVSYIAPENARSIAVAERLGGSADASADRPAAAPDCLVYRYWSAP